MTRLSVVRSFDSKKFFSPKRAAKAIVRSHDVSGMSTAQPADQLALFGSQPNPVLERLKKLDANSLTPMQALTLLEELSKASRQASPG